MRLLSQLPDSQGALIAGADGSTRTVGDIREAAGHLAAFRGGLIFVQVATHIDSLMWFLAALEAEVAVALLDPRQPAGDVETLVATYQPELLIDGSGKWTRHTRSPAPAVHRDLAVLLTTSGSTGSPRFVRLSQQNISANAQQIGQSLGIRPGDRAITSLPVFYSFGMSVITSHLLAGASVVVTDASVLEPRFWEQVRDHGVTGLAGVPTTFALLRRTGIPQAPPLRTMIQAGGRLPLPDAEYFHGLMDSRGGKFHIMYGQTEASPRISCLPHEEFPRRPGSVGKAVPGAHLMIVDEHGNVCATGETGEVVVTGPNIMMGYAQTREDCALGDVTGGRLATGDLGYLDADGFLWLTGRLKRIAKLAGARVSLDEIEQLAGELAQQTPLAGSVVAAVDAGDGGVALWCEGEDADGVGELRKQLARRLRVPPSLVSVGTVPELPRLANGKIDYTTLAT